jgi:hypothetical protein
MCHFAAERKRREQQAEIAAAPAATAYPPPYGVPLPVSTLPCVALLNDDTIPSTLTCNSKLLLSYNMYMGKLNHVPVEPQILCCSLEQARFESLFLPPYMLPPQRVIICSVDVSADNLCFPDLLCSNSIMSRNVECASS